MRIVSASATIINATPDLEKTIEAAGRTCYKSEDRITDDSAERFIEDVCFKKQHESVMEHGSITVRFVCDRGVSHELVRHRIASFSQESTRYCNYSKEKFGREITVISPAALWPDANIIGDPQTRLYQLWYTACEYAEHLYFQLLDNGAKAQEARSVLPNSLKTEVVMTANSREWLHVFKLRCAPSAHPQMREVMQPLQQEFRRRWPSIFGPVEKGMEEHD